MRVVLNMATLRSHGSAWVGQGILAGLGRIARDHQFLAFVPAQWDIKPFTDDSHIQIQQVPDGWSGKVLAEAYLIPRALSRFDADRLFSLTNTSVFKSPVPHLLLVQQAYLVYNWEHLSSLLPRQFKVKLKLLTWLFQLSMKSVDHFTVQSSSMRSRLCTRWGVAQNKVTVIPSAVEVSNVEVAKQKSYPERQSPYICYIAGPSVHKNFNIVVDMLAELKRRSITLDCHLTLHPEQFPDLVQRADELGIGKQIIWRGAILRDEVYALIANAQALVMPSWLESFGLPYFEAMALECPIVASDLDFAHAACADGALYADPNSAADFADQVQRLLTDDALREDLKTRQRQRYRAVSCSWDDVARQYMILLETMSVSNQYVG